MIKISLKGLAKFMTVGEAAKRKVLRDYKYPDPEGRAQATYYREARDLIVAYHTNRHQPDWLLKKAEELASVSRSASGQTKVRLGHNARALTEYHNHFAASDFEVLPDLKLLVAHAGVIIIVFPDLHVKSQGKEKIIKFEFATEPPDRRVINIISQMMFEASAVAKLGLGSRNILYLDVPRGRTHKAARVGARMRREIEAACENIAAIWDKL